ncbi:MAG: hypothetical protein ABSD27_03915 [Bryobacteraceae bacterium]
MVSAKKEPEEPATPNIIWTLVDDGRSNAEIIASIEAKGGRVSALAKAFSDEPVPPKGTKYPLVGIRGEELPTGRERSILDIQAEADRRKYRKSPARVGLLLREKFISQEALGYPCVVVFADRSLLLVLGAEDELDEWNTPNDRLDVVSAHEELYWGSGSLFVFLAPSQT